MDYWGLEFRDEGLEFRVLVYGCTDWHFKVMRVTTRHPFTEPSTLLVLGLKQKLWSV